MNLDEALAATRRELSDAEARLARARSEVLDLRQQEQGLARALERFVSPQGQTVVVDDPTASAAAAAPTSRDWKAAARTTAIIWAMEELGQAVRPVQVAEYLSLRGRAGDTAGNVGTTMHHLKAQGLVVSPCHGLWALDGSGDAPSGNDDPQSNSPAPDCDMGVIPAALDRVTQTAELDF